MPQQFQFTCAPRVCVPRCDPRLDDCATSRVYLCNLVSTLHSHFRLKFGNFSHRSAIFSTSYPLDLTWCVTVPTVQLACHSHRLPILACRALPTSIIALIVGLAGNQNTKLDTAIVSSIIALLIVSYLRSGKRQFGRQNLESEFGVAIICTRTHTGSLCHLLYRTKHKSLNQSGHQVAIL